MADDEVAPLTTSTANYGWVKPDVGASNDAWGGLLNTDLDGIDSTVKSVSNVANAAQTAAQVAAALAPYAPLASPALTGNPTAPTPTAGDNDTSLATTAFVTTAITTYPLNDNRIINGNFAINQRTYVSGTALATTVYGHDRWKAGPSGCTYTFTAALPDTTITITANTLTQVIEAGMIEGGVYTLSWTGTAQARVYQGAPTGSYAASPITTASLTAGTNTIVEFNAGTVTRVKLEIGSAVTPFNRQSLNKNIADCQRYFSTSYYNVAPGTAATSVGQLTFYVSGVTSATNPGTFPVFLPISMRALPTITGYSPVTGTAGKSRDNTASADVAFNAQAIGINSFNSNQQMSAAAVVVNFSVHYTASAEL